MVGRAITMPQNKLMLGIFSASLDDLICNFSFLLPNHLKIDVGGIENLIVQEAYEILQKSELQTIQIEISINNEQMGDMVK